ncbi:MAG: hypothetical protein KDA28_15440, partial [Phycisphaerales bacterium]|nr:hypothetical protein [Phycisphaerales bacterium]
MHEALLLVPTPDPLLIPPIERPFDVTIRPPGSKSLTNRLLLLASLSRGRSRLMHALTDAVDAQRMIEAVETLGASVTPIEGGLDVLGVDGTWPASNVRLDLHNAGTATRFLAAASVLAQGPVTIDGNERMRVRPIGELAEAIEHLGATITYGGAPG